ncbi:MAG: hypothetical protein EOM59_18845 [Clostridia bacterium]|nr:hypothetical protein [Clostridia bacterium]
MVIQKSESTVLPLPLDKNDRKVYTTSDVKTVDREGVTYYRYTEHVYDKDEYAEMIAEQNRADIDYVAIMTEVEL